MALPFRAKRGLLAALLAAAAVLFVALGVWQVERRAWKLDLIAAVDRRVHAAPQPAPGPVAWPGISAEAEAYTRVRASGTFLNDRETLVQAVTELGPGFWLLVPLRTDEGWTVLVNRGFAPPDRVTPETRRDGVPTGHATVTGLLRAPEPGGAFLRGNDPAANRWFSRDVAAIAAARDLGSVAPYFIDADARPNPGGFPIGGLTVVAFRNSHLVYAFTWFGLATLCLGEIWFLLTGRAEREKA
ncbi:SURF1 family protein [Roseomonas sp. KE2513]|uniref:SURF1 family protein n=1 Tax=Roseomonas sp. KE2513 TaxID=2479202 RepID=UPI0018DF8099|nr:SURF1 family protein [Roseomonas sp. KE2513]MBI0537762.1 SURF1 family protein [Roseomonas sp. KE2513]